MASEVGIRVKLTFPEALVRQPVLAHVIRDFNVIPDIRRAEITNSIGWIICELDGESDQIDTAIEWLKAEGVGVDLLGDLLES